MDPNPPESGEEFVHVDPLSESIVSLGDEVRDESSDRDETNGAVPVPEETKKVLPEELPRSVVILTCDSTAEGGTCDVYLVGTAHVSKESCREVEAIIDFLKPQVLSLLKFTQHLIDGRVILAVYSAFVQVSICMLNIYVVHQVPTVGEMVDMWKKKHNTFGILYSWFLAKVASHLEIFPGSEFRVAFEEAMKYGGKVILGDRPVQITLRRTWEKMPLWHKIKLLYSFLFQAFFLPSAEDLNRMLKEMDDVDMLTLVIQEMSKAFPTLLETLVHERDQYMSSTLLKVATEHSSVVAVVGKGHLQGIKNYWKQPVPVHDLMTIPSPKPAVSALKVLSSLGVAVAGVAIISGIYINCKK
ncbi:trab domain-containing protein [Citrus sinensis]|nr:trab domain-containing protein [Citrus sinensis]